MKPFIIMTSVLLAACAAFDGKSTVDFLTKGKGAFIEGDPIMVWLFGSSTPTPKRVWITGMGVIAAEIGIAFLVSHFWHPAVWLFSAQQVVHSVIHVRCWYHNESSLATYLKSTQK